MVGSIFIRSLARRMWVVYRDVSWSTPTAHEETLLQVG